MPDSINPLSHIFPVIIPAICDLDDNSTNRSRPHTRTPFQQKSSQFVETPPDADANNDLVDLPLSVYDAWLASRTYVTQVGSDGKIFRQPRPPGSTRQFNLTNVYLALQIIQSTFVQMVRLLWGLNPIRTFILVALTVIRGLLPAFRGYSHALILDEVSSAYLQHASKT